LQEIFAVLRFRTYISDEGQSVFVVGQDWTQGEGA